MHGDGWTMIGISYLPNVLRLVLSRLNRYSSTVPAYSSAGMIVDAVNSAAAWVRSTSVMTQPSTASR